MRRILLCLLLLWPGLLLAQGDQSDRGFIQGILEDNLSGPGRTVRIEGFAGALSSRATIDKITISDADGIWLTLSDVAMAWTRSALVNGRIEIDEISVRVLDLPRLPLPSEETATPEASGAFALPDIPVSVQIAEMRIDKATLGEPLFGEAAEVTFHGSAQLAGGAGEVKLDLRRLDKDGALRLTGKFDNATRRLGLELVLQEPEDGIAANLIGIPDRPSIRMIVTGEDPIDDFKANLQLATDGLERLSGDVTLRTLETGESQFAMNVGGDIAPIFAPAYRDFLGTDVRLVTEGARAPDGALRLDILRIQAAALRLEGEADIGADGWPRLLNLNGAIVPPDGESVVLPLTGAKTSVESVTLRGSFDAAAGDTWQLEGRALGVDREGTRLRDLDFSGEGAIARASKRVNGALNLQAGGLELTDPVLSRTIGTRFGGAVTFDWAKGEALKLSKMDLSGIDYGLTGAAVVNGLDDPGSLSIVPDVTLAATDLSRFAEISGLGLAGATKLDIDGTVMPLTGGLDLAMTGTTTGLVTGIAQLDPLLVGDGTMALALRRDETGLYAEPLTIRTARAKLTGNASLRSGASTVALNAELTDIADVLNRVTGPATLTAEASQDEKTWTITADAALPGEATLGYRGTVVLDGQRQRRVDGTLTGSIGRLAAFSGLAGRDLAGSADIAATLAIDLLASDFRVQSTGEGRNLDIGVPSLARLLDGATRFDIAVERNAEKVLRIDRLILNGTGLTASLSGQFGTETGALTYDVAVAELGQVLPDLPGTAAVTGTAQKQGPTWQIVADATLPGDTSLAYRGAVTLDGETQRSLDGTLTGTIGRLDAFGRLAQRKLSGALDINASGGADLVASTFHVEANGQTRDLNVAVPSVAPLLRGTTSFDVSLDRDAQKVIRIERMMLNGPGLNADVSGRIGPDEGALTYLLSVPNLGLVVSDLSGAAQVSGTAEKQGTAWQINVNGTGPGNIALDARGRVEPDGPRLDLSLNGNAPLSLVNPYLKGQAVSGRMQFDVAVNGPPALGSLSGRLSVADARLSIPARNLALNEISGQIDLAAGRAAVDLNSRVSSGGRLQLAGPVALNAPFDAQLVATLINVTLRDESLYEADLGGVITVDGPLTGGARIGGSVDLTTAELQIPQIGPSYSVLEGLRHIGPPVSVQRTLRFAGLDTSSQTRRAGRGFPVDLAVNAPNRLFVRGRGLDAELGGSLRLTGTTNALVPVGQFNLVRGRLDLLGRRLDLTEGSVALRGTFNPVIAFAASSEVDGTVITLRLEGLASAPELTVTSVPDMPEDEALSFFLFGRDVTSISPLQAIQLAAAIRTLSGSGGPGINERLRLGLGVDDLDISTGDDGQAQARVGKYISENIYTDIIADTTGNSQINLNLDLTPNITVRGRLGSDGETGLGVFYERDY